MHIFISYSSKDNKEAFKVCDLLEKQGKRCFIAPRDIMPGKEYGEEIVNGIDDAQIMVLLLSENSNKSPHVLREVERAVSKSVPILICKLEEVVLSKSMEYFLMTHQWVDMEAKRDYSKLLEWVNKLTKDESSKEVKTSPAQKGKKEAVTSRKTKKKKFFLAICAVVVICLLVGAGLGIKAVVDKNTIAPAQPGDTIVFGHYNGEPISWRVLKLKENGQAVLIAKDILTMKAYDAAEGGAYGVYWGESYYGKETEADTNFDLQIKVRGNNIWSASNIRTWLNSEEEVVTYADQPPHANAMSEKKNGYHNEAGFLHGFTQEERAAIVETENITNTNVLVDAETVTTVDKVYLLSLEELEWFQEAGMSVLATPTEAAVEQDQSKWYLIDVDAYNVKEYTWWLREPVTETASKCYLVGNGYWPENIHEANVGGEGFGIRPAITVDLKAEIIKEVYEATE